MQRCLNPCIRIFRSRTGEWVAVAGRARTCVYSPERVSDDEKPDNGQVLLSERDITRLPAQKRRIGMVFQDYALFPHMTLAENVAFAMTMADRIGVMRQGGIRTAPVKKAPRRGIDTSPGLYSSA
ncbi:ATP-binding cassette domain-containing protein [Vreelandella utahensis]|uniref:ATP-binding cassette domain-containing protein n=1 Tax=Vreelandella halophila TaxID=86177 RepID=UPI0009B5A75A|nr:ATP-binding cassette domain-containing protein [Halomonas utahensis]